MTRIHLLPVVVFAVGALLVLKSIGLFIADDYPVSPISPAAAQNAEPEMSEDGETAETENSVDAGNENPTIDKDGSMAIDQVARPNSEELLLQRLGERRSALEKRAAELDLREQLLNATELRVERRVTELKSIESRIQVAVDKREEKEAGRLKGLVQMYENMKPKDAARVFDRLSLDILVEVVRQIKPRKMSAILAKMSSETAERLTVAIATDRATEPEMEAASTELPKIEGKPTN